MKGNVAVLIVAATVLAALLALGVTGGLGPRERGSKSSGREYAGFAHSLRYVFYIGLNDADQHGRTITRDEAEIRLNAIADTHVDGYTVLTGKGFWRDADGRTASEDTLVYIFYDATEEEISAMLREMRQALNQRAILVEKSDVRRMFFAE